MAIDWVASQCTGNPKEKPHDLVVPVEPPHIQSGEMIHDGPLGPPIIRYYKLAYKP